MESPFDPATIQEVLDADPGDVAQLITDTFGQGFRGLADMVTEKYAGEKYHPLLVATSAMTQDYMAFMSLITRLRSQGRLVWEEVEPTLRPGVIACVDNALAQDGTQEEDGASPEKESVCDEPSALDPPTVGEHSLGEHIPEPDSN